MSESEHALLRHLLATLAYRGHAILDGMPPEAAVARLHRDIRTPAEILVHVNELLEYTLSALDAVPPPVEGRSWAAESERYFDMLGRLDDVLSDGPTLSTRAEQRLVQGPASDVLIHLGQIGLIRRAAGAPVAAEDYSRADISASRPRDAGGGSDVLG